MKTIILFSFALLLSVQGQDDLVLDYETALEFAQLPLECYQTEYPHKFQLQYNSHDDLHDPKEIHPVFYGCFDWHSAVHGHWLLQTVRNKFNNTDLSRQVEQVFVEQFTDPAKIETELKVFNRADNNVFERTYGWAWLLKLHNELLSDVETQTWAQVLKPLADRLVQKYKDFLPSLVYSIRVGEHSNTAFGLIFALEYAQRVEDQAFIDLIRHNATNHYKGDQQCPINWEPSGQDFLSPCLQEADLMGRILGKDEFATWLKAFLPQLFDVSFQLAPGQVLDATDGKLVHIHGVNFSRAWNLYSIILRLGAEYHADKLRFLEMADNHLRASNEEIVGGDYAGTHWLASFYVYALVMREEAVALLDSEPSSASIINASLFCTLAVSLLNVKIY